ncbi:hypothetical protein L218DRAFT_861607 [Marasmius fiardii PR-910]|nr:hypothetical protein L218DRAFT_861607 [Marasmius fiardii PR-910]
MDKHTQASQLFSCALYTLRRGCALWIPEPNKALTSEYRQNGVQIGDIGILRADGSFDFVFNVCRSANDPINQYGVPNGFQPLLWNGAIRMTDGIFRPGEPVLSRGAEKRALGVEGSASLPGVPVGAGAGFSIKFSKDCGAVILPPNGAASVDCQNLAVFRNYAGQHAASWYRFVNETLGMEIENGAIYFVTGFDKTDCWENAVLSNNMKERMFEVIVNTGGLVGGNGRFHLSNSTLLEAFTSRCSPPDNVNHNQALFIRGFRISIPHRLKTFFSGSSVEVTSTYNSSWRDAFGKRNSDLPFSYGSSSSSGSGSSGASGSFPGTLSSTSPAAPEHDSDTSMEEEDLVPSSELYHPLNLINDYILQSTVDRNDIEIVITHDEDWFALLTDEVSTTA